MPDKDLIQFPDFVSEYSALFSAIRKIVPPSMKMYLVGGAVRDIMLQRKIHDFDFSVEGLVRPIGKHIANELKGAYYVLDDEREMVRVIIDDEEIGQFDVDISLLTGEHIEDDLRERDFTLNAMAIELGSTPRLIDPLGGMDDLQNGILRMCGADSLANDPMRALRAIRMSLEFGLKMDDELQAEMKNCFSCLHLSSMERYRDELFKIIRLYKNGTAVRMLHDFEYLDFLFPAWKESDGTVDPDSIDLVDKFLLMLTMKQAEEVLNDEFAAYASRRLGNSKEALRAFFNKSMALYHTRRMLMSFASITDALSGMDTDKVKSWCGRLAFSSSETNFVLSAMQACIWLNSSSVSSNYNDVDIYRYFRQFREGGVAGLILYLAKNYSLRTELNSYKHWCERVLLVQDHISAYFTRYNDVIAPKPLLSGDDIQNLLGIPAGPVIGEIKNALIEAQIRGSVQTIEEAESIKNE